MTAPAAPTAITAGAVGAAVGPLTSAVDARWLMAYAAGLGETDPRYFDTLAPAGPAAHPLFAVCVEWPAVVAARALVIDGRLAPRGVHATHRVRIHRAPRAGDTLRTMARVTAVRPQRAGTLVLMRLETVDAEGLPVTTTDYGSVFRGVACDGAVGSTGVTGPGPAAADAPVRWEASVPIAPQAAHVYSECARIWNPIHTDVAVARAAGLPGPILHGTTTLALAVSRVVTRELGGNPDAVREISARFIGMVPVPARLVVRGRAAAGDTIPFDAIHADTGRTVLAGALGA